MRLKGEKVMAQFIYGRNTVSSALKESKVKKLFLQSNFSDSKLLSLVKSTNIKVEYKSSNELTKLANGGNHQGIIAEIADYSYIGLNELIKKSKKKEYPLIVMLDGISDPHNLGAILRSADAFGADGIIVKKHGQAPLNATVLNPCSLNFLDSSLASSILLQKIKPLTRSPEYPK